MCRGKVFTARVALAVFLAAALLPGVSGTSAAAEYPRRIAIAPFESLTGEDIKPTVAILPRLLSSRLMALAGADVLLLARSGASPEASAKEAGFPLLATGTVSRVGKGYSIDALVSDLATGKTAGAFVVAAATEDEIIPQLGVLAGDIAEKIFGIRQVVRPLAAPAPPAGAVPASAAAPAVSSPAGPLALPAASPPRKAAPPAAAVPAGPWEPRSITRVSASDKIPDKIFRVSAGDVDRDNVTEVAAIGSRRLFVYKVQGDKVLPFRKMERDISHLFLNVEVADLDGDGAAEIVVTDLRGGALKTFVLKMKGEVLDPLALDIPYFVVSLDDGNGGRRLAGQAMGVSEPYYGRVVYLKWDARAMTLVPDGDVPVKVSDGPFGLAPFPGDAERRHLYIDADQHLRIVDGKGKTTYKSKDYYAGAVHMFTWGEATRANVGPDRHYVRGRIAPVVRAGLPPLFLLRQSKGGTVLKEYLSFDWSRILFITWDGDGFSEKASSERTDTLMTDFAVLGGAPAPGTLLAVSATDWSGSPFASQGETSRIHLYKVE